MSDVVVAKGLVRGFSAGGEKNHRDVGQLRIRPDAFADIEPIRIRQHDI